MMESLELETILVEIEESLMTTKSGLVFAKHPLYNTLWTHEGMDEIDDPTLDGQFFGRKAFEGIIKQKIKTIKEAMEKRNWSTVIFTHERPWRPTALGQILDCSDDMHAADLLSTQEAAQLILDVWIDTEFPHQSWEIWAKIFDRVTPDDLNAILSDEDKAAREDLPERFPIYRGVGHDEELIKELLDPGIGFSWTTSIPKACWFGERFGDTAVVVTDMVSKKHTVGPLTGRGESEILMIKPWLMRINKGAGNVAH